MCQYLSMIGFSICEILRKSGSDVRVLKNTSGKTKCRNKLQYMAAILRIFLFVCKANAGVTPRCLALFALQILLSIAFLST